MISSSSPKIGIAIVQWNHSDLTLSLLKSLNQFGSKYRVALCDNGSDSEHVDSIQSFLNKQYKQDNNTANWQIKLLSNQHNSGFARAMNQSIKCLLTTDCDWIWLLNNDISVSSKVLNSLPNQLLDKKADLYGITLLEAENEKIAGGYTFNFWTTRHNPAKTVSEFNQSPQANKYISGASMIIHRKVFQDVGLLNEQSFLYFEELDFTYRARKLGYLQHCLDEPTIEHIGAGSSGGTTLPAQKKRIYHETWSTLNFYANHKPLLFLWVLIARTPLRLITLFISKRSRLIPTVLKASFDYFQHKNTDRADIKIKTTATYKIT